MAFGTILKTVDAATLAGNPGGTLAYGMCHHTGARLAGPGINLPANTMTFFRSGTSNTLVRAFACTVFDGRTRLAPGNRSMTYYAVIAGGVAQRSTPRLSPNRPVSGTLSAICDHHGGRSFTDVLGTTIRTNPQSATAARVVVRAAITAGLTSPIIYAHFDRHWYAIHNTNKLAKIHSVSGKIVAECTLPHNGDLGDGFSHDGRSIIYGSNIGDKLYWLEDG